jgi:hypothetical protein
MGKRVEEGKRQREEKKEGGESKKRAVKVPIHRKILSRPRGKEKVPGVDFPADGNYPLDQ